MLHAFMFTLSGVPVLYSGDEIAQENDYTYHEDPLKAEDSRYLHRGKAWTGKKAETDKENHAGGKDVRRDPAAGNAPRRSTVFDTEADTWLLDTGNDHVLGIGRYYRGEQLLALFNFSGEPQKAWVRDDKTATDLISGKEGDAGDRPAGRGLPLAAAQF